MPNYRSSFGDVLREHRRSMPDQLALADGAHRATWTETDDRVNRLANALADAGVGSGNRILWLGQNSFRVYELLGAAAKVGAMVCPGYWRWAAPEMAFAVTDFAPTVVIWEDAEIGATVAEARALVGDSHKALWLRADAEGDGVGSYEHFLSQGSPDDPEREVDPDSALLVIYTAALSGRQAGSMLSHTNLLAMGTTVAAAGDIDSSTVFLNAGPMFHIGNFQFFGVPTFVQGGTNVVVAKADVAQVLAALADHRCTRAYLMPVTVHQLVELNRTAGRDLSALRATFLPGAWAGTVEPDTSRIGRLTGPRGAGYGQTELTGLAVRSDVGPASVGNVGRPSPLVTVRILDAAGNECPVGEAGEICARGDLVHLGYWNRPETNAERFRFGWWHTTDLGRREADGSLSFLGTMTRMLKTGAENVFPAEVENCLRSHPAVRDAAVIGVPNPAMAQDVKAVVALADGATATADELVAHCRAHIASYKKPKTVEFVEAIPRTAVGTIDYDELDARFGGGGYPGGKTLGAGS